MVGPNEPADIGGQRVGRERAGGNDDRRPAARVRQRGNFVAGERDQRMLRESLGHVSREDDAIDRERGLRLDHCETCGGYLKTYDGEGSEAVLLADWTSLHLDFIARDRGLTRMAGSLYDLDN